MIRFLVLLFAAERNKQTTQFDLSYKNKNKASFDLLRGARFPKCRMKENQNK